MLKQQLVFPAIFLIFGIYFYQSNLSLYTAIYLLTIFILFFLIKQQNKPKIIFLFLALISFFGIQYRSATIKNNFLNTQNLIKYPGQYSGLIYNLERIYNSKYNYCITIKLNKYKSKNLKINLNYFLKIYCINKPRVNIGSYIKTENIQILQESSSQNSRFFYYNLKENIIGVAFIQSLKFKEINKNKFNRYKFRDIINTRVKNKLTPKTSLLFSSIFLGEKTSHPYFQILREKFLTWGLSHYLARSGLHITLIAIILIFLFRFISSNFILTYLLALISVIIYSLLTIPSVSYLRALILFIIYILCLLRTREFDLLNSVLLSGIILLAYNPYYLFSIDFQLSFGLTLSIAIYNEYKQTLELL